MTTRPTARQPLPSSPGEYDKPYMDRLVSMIEAVLEDISNPGAARNTTLTVTAMPTDPNGLLVGDVYREGCFLKIVNAGEIFPPTGSVVITGLIPTVVEA